MNRQNYSKYDFILKNINRHVKLNRSEIDFFCSILEFKTYKKKELILMPNKIADYEIFINSGCVKCYTIDNKGVEHISLFAIEGWWTGDLYSYISDKPATFFIETIEDSEIITISKQQKEILYKKVLKFERFFRTLYQNSLASHIRRINQNISFSAEEKYLNFKKNNPAIEKRVSQKNLASYLGVTPEFLSLLKKRLSNKS
ncbi:Crp/Fnr family transcriptional regulator [uncultured Kordia sp.]|uniref:Crp/Fnr family transcriptional regulator n=1 Tax=uncultured Kordia sp. TaxID=507699 RepID=UPI00262418AF|nr:Crp/Fnr family transcriptional regulator [uncultured Kordia sp.]